MTFNHSKNLSTFSKTPPKYTNTQVSLRDNDSDTDSDVSLVFSDDNNKNNKKRNSYKDLEEELIYNQQNNPNNNSNYTTPQNPNYVNVLPPQKTKFMSNYPIPPPPNQNNFSPRNTYISFLPNNIKSFTSTSFQ